MVQTFDAFVAVVEESLGRRVPCEEGMSLEDDLLCDSLELFMIAVSLADLAAVEGRDAPPERFLNPGATLGRLYEVYASDPRNEP